ncbi:MAG: hypothetical protein ABF491_07255, partial [Acetobacter sp.]
MAWNFLFHPGEQIVSAGATHCYRAARPRRRFNAPAAGLLPPCGHITHIPASGIRHPASGIRHPASGIR